MYPFPYMEPVCCSMSRSNCCFLTCKQISQEAGKVVWYFHLFQNCVVIYTVKGFGLVNKAKVDVFLEFSCFFNDPADVGNLISCSSVFSKSSLNTWKFMVPVLLKPGLENLSITWLVSEMSANVWSFEHPLSLPFFGIRMKTDLFLSCGHCWVLHFCSNIDKFTSQVLQSGELSGYVCIADGVALVPVPEMWTAKHFGRTQR